MLLSGMNFIPTGGNNMKSFLMITMLIISSASLFAQQELQIDTTKLSEAKKQRLELMEKIYKEGAAREAAFQEKIKNLKIGENSVSQILKDIIPFLKEEVEGTKIGKRFTNFYLTDIFKQSGAVPFEILTEESLRASEKEALIAYWDDNSERMFFSLFYFNKWLQENNLPEDDFFNSNDNIKRFAICLAPVFIHESQHQRTYLLMKEKKLKRPSTKEEEFLAAMWERLFMYEKSQQNPAYYSACGPRFKNFSPTTENVAAHINKAYANIPAGFNNPNIRKLISSRKQYDSLSKQLTDGQKETLKKVYGIPKIINTLKIEHILVNSFNVATWENLPISELLKVVNGQSPVYNEFRKIYEEETQELERTKEEFGIR
jgi:hypothetical protein